MGWWKVQGTEDLVGDEVFDLVRDAALAVAAEYERAVGRSPTRREWERLLLMALYPVKTLESTVTSYVVNEGKPATVEIRMEAAPTPSRVDEPG